jgi:hypothetical protein
LNGKTLIKSYTLAHESKRWADGEFQTSFKEDYISLLDLNGKSKISIDTSNADKLVVAGSTTTSRKIQCGFFNVDWKA